jgi:diguanylate cyclase
VIVMPMHEAEEATQFAERFRQHIGNRAVKGSQSGREVGRVTLSLGVAGLIAGDTPQTLIDRADAALYDAKAEGRDRVVCWKAAA